MNIQQRQTQDQAIQKNELDQITIEKARLMYGSLIQKYPAIMCAKEVADLLRLKENTIRNWTSQNAIPHQKMGGAARYVLTDIIFWILTRNKRGQRKKEKEN